jgi:hypothetical protein
MLRPKHKWYREYHGTMCGMFSENIKTMGVQNVAKIDGSHEWLQIFENHGVHLTELAGKVYVEHLLAGAEGFFREKVVDLVEETVQMDTQKSEDANWVAKRISVVEKEIGNLSK